METLEAAFSKKLGQKFRLNRYSVGESLDRSRRVRSAYNAEGEQIRDLTPEEVSFVTNEISLSKWDFEYCTRYLSISGSSGQLVPFQMRPSQRKVFNEWAKLEEAGFPLAPGKIALIIAKARRVGATVLGEAAIAHNVMFRSQAKGLVASCEPTNSLELYKILTRIYDNLPPWMRPKMSGRVKAEHLYFEPPLDSDITVGHGAQQNPMGQGVRLDAIHLTEMSAWLEVGTKQVDDDIWPAFASSQAPTTLFFIESTGESSMDANAAWFKEQFDMASRGKGFFRSVFVSWYDCPEIHTASSEGITFTEEVLYTADSIKRETGFEVSKDQLAWYQITREQYAEKGNLSGFFHQYPSHADDCFKYGMPSAWPVEIIDKVRNECPPLLMAYDIDYDRKKVRDAQGSTYEGIGSKRLMTSWDKDPNGRILIYEPPKGGFSYVIGVDAAYGEQGKDSSAIYVNRVGTVHLPDKQVAEFWSETCSPSELASVCWILGHMYTDRETGLPALMAIESNPGSPGIVTQSDLIKMGYPNFYIWRKENSTTGGQTNTIGWYTTGGTRPMLCKRGVEAIQKGYMKVSSTYLVNEMSTFVNYGFKRRSGVDGFEYFAHAQGEHDDRLFAAFIAYWVAHDLDRVNIADERRLFWESKLRADAPKAPRLKDWQNTDGGDLLNGDAASLNSWEDCVQAWEDKYADFF